MIGGASHTVHEVQEVLWSGCVAWYRLQFVQSLREFKVEGGCIIDVEGTGIDLQIQSYCIIPMHDPATFSAHWEVWLDGNRAGVWLQGRFTLSP